LDDFDAVEASEKTERENVRALGRVASTLPGRFRAGMGAAALDHLVRLHACVMVKDPQPLDERRLAEVTTRLLEGYLGEKAWEGFAAAVRSLWRLVEARNGFRPAVTARLENLRSAIAGGPVVTLCAHHIASAPREFNRWARWFFSHAGVLQAPEILAAINQSETSQGTDFLKDLLHRQGTASLEPWAARLRDPNPGVVSRCSRSSCRAPWGPTRGRCSSSACAMPTGACAPGRWRGWHATTTCACARPCCPCSRTKRPWCAKKWCTAS
jgi:hypothetical protein